MLQLSIRPGAMGLMLLDYYPHYVLLEGRTAVASFTFKTIFSNPAGSLTAISASDFLFKDIWATFNPFINRLYEMPYDLHAALIRVIHKERKSLFFCFLPAKAYLRALNTVLFAMLYALRLRSYIPLARLSIFFLLLLALNPRFALGIANHPCRL